MIGNEAVELYNRMSDGIHNDAELSYIIRCLFELSADRYPFCGNYGLVGTFPDYNAMLAFLNHCEEAELRRCKLKWHNATGFGNNRIMIKSLFSDFKNIAKEFYSDSQSSIHVKSGDDDELNEIIKEARQLVSEHGSTADVVERLTELSARADTIRSKAKRTSVYDFTQHVKRLKKLYCKVALIDKEYCGSLLPVAFINSEPNPDAIRMGLVSSDDDKSFINPVSVAFIILYAKMSDWIFPQLSRVAERLLAYGFVDSLGETSHRICADFLARNSDPTMTLNFVSVNDKVDVLVVNTLVRAGVDVALANGLIGDEIGLACGYPLDNKLDRKPIIYGDNCQLDLVKTATHHDGYKHPNLFANKALRFYENKPLVAREDLFGFACLWCDYQYRGSSLTFTGFNLTKLECTNLMRTYMSDEYKCFVRNIDSINRSRKSKGLTPFSNPAEYVAQSLQDFYINSMLNALSVSIKTVDNLGDKSVKASFTLQGEDVTLIVTGDDEASCMSEGYKELNSYVGTFLKRRLRLARY